MKLVLTAALVTLALGFATAAAFYAVGGSLALRGPYVLVREWPAIYTLVVVFAVIVGVALGWLTSSWPLRRLAIVVVAGWVGEYLVLSSRLLADELSLVTALGFWILATIGPIQPIAAWLGGILGRRLRRGQQSPASAS